MRRRNVQLVLMIVAALWLPVQAIASIGMPYCRHGQPQAMSTAAVADHCHGPAKKADHGKHGQSCDQCDFCHLATAGFMPSGEDSPVLLALIEGYGPSIEIVPDGAVPEPPRQPPKRST